MLAMATSLRTNSTIASTAAPKPCGAFPSRWRRATWRPPYQIVRNTSAAAMPMKTTCLVGETFTPKITQSVGRCVSRPNGHSITWLSEVCSKMALPISGPWIISGIPSPQRAAAKAPRGSRATRAARQGRRARSPHTPAAPRAPAPEHPSRRANGPGKPAGGRASRVAAAPPPRAVPPPPPPRRSPHPGRHPTAPPPPPAPAQGAAARGTASPLRVALHAIVDGHEPAEPADRGAHQREPRPRAEPTVHHPSQRAEGEDRDREGEPQGDVRIAFAEAPAEAILLVIWHDADGNIPACEKFRKQSHNHANLCGAWEYDVLTWSQHDGKPISRLASRIPAARRRRAARAPHSRPRRPARPGRPPQRGPAPGT